MLRSVYSRDHRTELIQMTVLWVMVLPLPSSSGAMPRSYAVPAGLRRTLLAQNAPRPRKKAKPPAAGPRRAASEAPFEYWVALMVPSGVHPTQGSAL